MPNKLRYLLLFLRYGLLVAAIAYLAFSVQLYDTIELVSGERAVVVEARADELVVKQDGERVTAAWPTDPETGERRRVTPGLITAVRGMDLSVALLAVLAFLPVPFLAALRLVWMLKIQEVPLKYWPSTKLTYAGNFFNFAMPGTTGGDLIKAYYLTRFTHRKTEAVTTIFLDRVIGVLGLAAVAGAVFVFGGHLVQWDETMKRTIGLIFALVATVLTSGVLLILNMGLNGGMQRIVGGMAAILGLAGVAFYFTASPVFWGSALVLAACFALLLVLMQTTKLGSISNPTELLEKLPAGEHLVRIGDAVAAMRRHKFLILGAFGLTVVIQMSVVISAFAMARSLDMQGSPALYFICVPLGFLIAAIPISPPQAIGVMEAAYIQFFTQQGLNAASIVLAFAVAVRLVQLVWALPGALVPMLGAHLPSRHELEEFEHSSEEDVPEPSRDQAGPATEPTGGGVPEPQAR